MLYTLLWAFGLVAAQCWVALTVRLSAGAERRAVRVVVQTALLLPCLLLAGTACFLGYMAHRVAFFVIDWFPYCVAWIVALILSWIVIAFFGSRPVVASETDASASPEPEGPEAVATPRCAAVTWPTARLLIAMAVACGAWIVTCFAVDAGARWRLGEIRERQRALLESDMAQILARGENSADCYRTAWEPLGDIEEWPTGEELGGLEEFLAQHAETLEALRPCAEKPVCLFRTSVEDTGFFSSFADDVTRLQRLQRLFEEKARLAAYGGDTVGVLRELDTMGAIARQIGGQPSLIASLIAARQLAAEGELVEILLAHEPSRLPDASSWQDRAPRDTSALARQSSVELAQLSLLMASMLAGHSVEPLLDTAFDSPYGASHSTSDAIGTRLSLIFFRLIGGVAEIGNLDVVGARFDEALRAPIGLVPERARAVEDTLRGPGAGYIAVALVFTARARIAEMTLLDPLAWERVIAVALAAERHRAATGAYPQTLDDLVPSQLAAKPLDPWSEGDAPIRLEPIQDGVLVYSVGSEGFEDADTALFEERGPPAIALGPAYASRRAERDAERARSLAGEADQDLDDLDDDDDDDF